ncbi:MAG: Fur family transcriptional regulator [Chloroflexota bacterium]
MNTSERVVQSLRHLGERMTLQRRFVIEVLSESGAHMTIGDVRAHIEERHAEDSLPEPTIYRILQWLKDLGFVSQTDVGESGTVYQLIDGEPHHHLICLKCNQTIDIDDDLFDNLRDRIQETYQFDARIDHMAIYGICKGCS